MAINNQKEHLASQELVSIDQIRDGVVILKNGALRSVLKVSGINMELKSEAEQNEIINEWRNFLNSLDFDLQVIVASRKANINKYLEFLKENTKNETSELLKIQIEDYYNFVKNFVEVYSVIRKDFYVVVPYEPVILKPTGILPRLGSGLTYLFNLSRPAFTTTVTLSDEDFAKNQHQLFIRQANVISGLNRIGLECQPLNTEELIELYYSLYNPGLTELEKINI